MPLKLKIKRTHRYNVAAKGCFVLAIVTLDGSHLEYTINSNTTGLDCLAFVAQKLELDNTDYYGFRYRESDLDDPNRWIVLDKSVKKQLDRYARELKLHFGVMYFVENAHNMADLTVRRQYYLQMKQDILFSRVTCTLEQAIHLAAYSLQADLGPWEDSRMDFEQLKEYRHVPSCFVDFPDSGKYYKLVDEIVQCYRQLGDVHPTQAEANYIAMTQKMPNFGEERFQCEGRRSGPCVLGVSRNGISVYQRAEGKSEETEPLILRWESIKHLVYSKRVFTIHRIHNSKAISFTMADLSTARYVYYYCIQMHGFYVKYWTARNQSVPGVERSASAPLGSLHSSSLPPPDIQLCSQRDSFVSAGTSSTAENAPAPPRLLSGSLPTSALPLTSTALPLPTSAATEPPFSHQTSFLSSDDANSSLASQSHRQPPSTALPPNSTLPLSNGLAARHTRFVSNSLSQLPVIRARQLSASLTQLGPSAAEPPGPPVCCPHSPAAGGLPGVPMRAVVSSLASEARLPSYRRAPDYATVMQQRDLYLRQNAPPAMSAAPPTMSAAPPAMNAAPSALNPAAPALSSAPAQYCSPIYDNAVVQPPSPFLDKPPLQQLLASSHPLPQHYPQPHLVQQQQQQLQQQHFALQQQQQLQLQLQQAQELANFSIPDFFQLMSMAQRTNADSRLTCRLLEEYKQSILQSQAYHNNSVSTPNLSSRELYDSAADYVNADAIIQMQQQQRAMREAQQLLQQQQHQQHQQHYLQHHMQQQQQQQQKQQRRPPPPPPHDAQRPLSACSEDSNATFLIRNAADYEFVDVAGIYERQRTLASASTSTAQESPYETLTPVVTSPPPSSRPPDDRSSEERPRYRPRVPREQSCSSSDKRRPRGSRPYTSPSHRVYANVRPGPSSLDSPSSSAASTSSYRAANSSQEFSSDHEGDGEEGFDSGDGDSESCNEYIVNHEGPGEAPANQGGDGGHSVRMRRAEAANGGATAAAATSESKAPVLSSASRMGLTVSRANLLWEQSEAKESRVPKDEKRQRMEAVLREGPTRLAAEFDSIPGLAKKKDCLVAASEENRNRNSPDAPEVLPYDESRVKITPTSDNFSGYVNASHVRVRVKGREEWYIAAQTPHSDRTGRDFWYMVWETQIHVVARLCDPSSRDEGPARYLPSEPGEDNALVFDDLTVTLTSSTHSGSFVTSRLSLRQRSLPGAAQFARTLWLFHYVEWDAEEDVPLNVYNFARFLDELSSLNRHVSSERGSGLPGPPVLFHCASGAGRSGLAILIQVMTSCLDHNQDMDLPTVLTRLRGCRMQLVRSAEQYTFVYRALVAYLYNSRLI